VSTVFCLALVVTLTAPQQAAAPRAADAQANDDTAADVDEETAPDSGDPGEAPSDEATAPAPAETTPSAATGDPAAPGDAPATDDQQASADAQAPPAKEAAAEPASADPLAPDAEAPDARASPPDASVPPPLDEGGSVTDAPPPTTDEGQPATTRRRAAVDPLIEEDAPVTSVLAVSGQLATGAAACCIGMPLAGVIGLPLNLIPFAGPFIGPCALQAGFCAITAVGGGAAEVFVGDALGPGHGALLPVIGAQAVAHLTASLVGTVVGLAAVGTAVGLALPNLPSDPLEQVGYLYNDPGVILAMGVTAAVFLAAIGASLAAGPIAYALTAEPKKGPGFKMPRLAESAPPPKAAVASSVRY
jgi:hypothetical protein